MEVARGIWWELGGSTHAKCSVMLDTRLPSLNYAGSNVQPSVTTHSL
jgi:hypothetical protein